MLPSVSKMPWFTKYVEGLVKNVNVLFHSGTRAKRPGRGLTVTCCTGRPVELGASYTEEDYRFQPSVSFPRAREGALYSLLIVDLQGHGSLHAKRHRLAWVQHNIPGAAFAKGDLSSGTVCTPYRPPCSRRGFVHVMVMVFEQRRTIDSGVSPVFAEDCRLSLWLSRYGTTAERMVVCEELHACVEGLQEVDSRSTTSSELELELPTVTFHRLESPTKNKCFVFDDRNGWVSPKKKEPQFRLDSPCAKRIKVF